MMYGTLYPGPSQLTWQQRLLFGVVLTFGVAVGLVFGTLMLGLGALAALAAGLRIAWLRRRKASRAARPADFIEGECQVLDDTGEPAQRRQPPGTGA